MIGCLRPGYQCPFSFPSRGASGSPRVWCSSPSSIMQGSPSATLPGTDIPSYHPSTLAPHHQHPEPDSPPLVATAAKLVTEQQSSTAVTDIIRTLKRLRQSHLPNPNLGNFYVRDRQPLPISAPPTQNAASNAPRAPSAHCTRSLDSVIPYLDCRISFYLPPSTRTPSPYACHLLVACRSIPPAI